MISVAVHDKIKFELFDKPSIFLLKLIYQFLNFRWNLRDEFSLPHQHIERLEPLAYRIPTSGIAPFRYIEHLQCSRF